MQVPGGMVGKAVEFPGLVASGPTCWCGWFVPTAPRNWRASCPVSPRFVVSASPGQFEVARTYTVLGIEHILLGIDHLLFVLALVLLVKGIRRLIATITAFTVAHSITLALASLGVLQVPGPPVEASIALSIVFVASEIIHARQGRPGLTQRYPWVVAFTFGLLHGLGFAGALAEVGLPPLAIPDRAAVLQCRRRNRTVAVHCGSARDHLARADRCSGGWSGAPFPACGGRFPTRSAAWPATGCSSASRRIEA